MVINVNVSDGWAGRFNNLQSGSSSSSLFVQPLACRSEVTCSSKLTRKFNQTLGQVSGLLSSSLKLCCEVGGRPPPPSTTRTHYDITADLWPFDFHPQGNCQPCWPGYYCDSAGLSVPSGKCTEGFFCLEGADRPDPPFGDGSGAPCPKGIPHTADGEKKLNATTIAKKNRNNPPKKPKSTHEQSTSFTSSMQLQVAKKKKTLQVNGAKHDHLPCRHSPFPNVTPPCAHTLLVSSSLIWLLSSHNQAITVLGARRHLGSVPGEPLAERTAKAAAVPVPRGKHCDQPPHCKHTTLHY